MTTITDENLEYFDVILFVLRKYKSDKYSLMYVTKSERELLKGIFDEDGLSNYSIIEPGYYYCRALVETKAPEWDSDGNRLERGYHMIANIFFRYHEKTQEK